MICQLTSRAAVTGTHSLRGNTLANPVVKDTRNDYSGNTFVNGMELLIRSINGEIYTAEVVKVQNVDSGGSGSATGYVDVLPLVSQVDAYDNIVPNVTLFHLPYFRLQGGRAAVVLDPKPGDIGIAVYLKRDSSGVVAGQDEPVKPSTLRVFDQADGYYIGGFLNAPPEVFIEIAEDGNITIDAYTKVTINTANAEVNATTTNINATTTNVTSNAVNVTAPTSTFNGNVQINGGIVWTGTASGTGGGSARFVGGFVNTGGVITSNGVTLETHIHSGVEPGGGETGEPV